MSGLKSVVLSGVTAAKAAIGSLAVPVKLVNRPTVTHVPGGAPVHTENLSDIKVVLTSYTAKEVDGDRIKASDIRGLIFPETGKPIPKPNDLLRVLLSPLKASFPNGDYRVVHNDKIMAGDEVALSDVQLRPM